MLFYDLFYTHHQCLNVLNVVNATYSIPCTVYIFEILHFYKTSDRFSLVFIKDNEDIWEIDLKFSEMVSISQNV